MVYLLGKMIELRQLRFLAEAFGTSLEEVLWVAEEELLDSQATPRQEILTLVEEISKQSDCPPTEQQVIVSDICTWANELVLRGAKPPEDSVRRGALPFGQKVDLPEPTTCQLG